MFSSLVRRGRISFGGPRLRIVPGIMGLAGGVCGKEEKEKEVMKLTGSRVNELRTGKRKISNFEFRNRNGDKSVKHAP